MTSLGEQLDPRQPLKQLADTLPRVAFEPAFGPYSSDAGRPAKPVRLMVGYRDVIPCSLLTPRYC